MSLKERNYNGLTVKFDDPKTLGEVADLATKLITKEGADTVDFLHVNFDGKPEKYPRYCHDCQHSGVCSVKKQLLDAVTGTPHILLSQSEGRPFSFMDFMGLTASSCSAFRENEKKKGG